MRAEKRFNKFIIGLATFSLPALVLAGGTENQVGIAVIINKFTDVGLKIIPLLGAMAFLFFVWGVARFIKSAGSEKEIKDSKNIIIWGIVGLFILITIWGIIAFLRSEFGFSGDTVVPQINL